MSRPKTRYYCPEEPVSNVISFKDMLPVQEQNLLQFVMDVIQEIDLSAFYKPYENNRRGGNTPYDPTMLISLLVYAYIKGVRSSREIEMLTKTHLAFVHISGRNFPNYRTIARFRRRHLKDFEKVFSEILLFAKKQHMLSVGDIAIDGTKIRAYASKLKNRRVVSEDADEAICDQIVDDILTEVHKTDKQETKEQGSNNRYLQKGPQRNDIPHNAKEKFKEFKQQRQAEHKQPEDSPVKSSVVPRIKLQSKSTPPNTPEKPSQHQDLGTKKRQRVVKPKIENLTDPDSRLMKTSQEGFQQSYNAQIATDKDTQLILGTKVTQRHNDQGQLHPMIDEVQRNLGEKPISVYADAGYSNERDLQRLEARKIEGIIATRRNVDLKRNVATARMSKKLSSPEGRARYKCRAWVAEAPIAWLKGRRNFRQFSVRGLESVSGEFALACAAQNLVRMFALRQN